MTATQKEGIQTSIQSYLFFGGRCDEALEFYKQTLDAKIDHLIRFNESPEPPPPGIVPDGFGNKVMHCSFRIRGTTLMASDGCDPDTGFNGFSLCLTIPTEAETRRIFDLLADGGTVRMAPTKTFWSPCYGMLTDRFGIAWMIMVPDQM